jgi:hypothetical protein
MLGGDVMEVVGSAGAVADVVDEGCGAEAASEV